MYAVFSLSTFYIYNFLCLLFSKYFNFIILISGLNVLSSVSHKMYSLLCIYAILTLLLLRVFYLFVCFCLLFLFPETISSHLISSCYLETIFWSSFVSDQWSSSINVTNSLRCLNSWQSIWSSIFNWSMVVCIFISVNFYQL